MSEELKSMVEFQATLGRAVSHERTKKGWTDGIAALGEVIATYSAALTRVEELEKFITEMEWAGVGQEGDAGWCVMCWAHRENGHRPDCELTALMPSSASHSGAGGAEGGEDDPQHSS